MEKWIDITTSLKTSVLSLELGHLIHDNNFGLYEAMSAIEIMEPKMDSGLIYTGNSRKILSFSSAIDENYVILEDCIPLTKIIFIIDYTYASLIKWLEGSNFVQTLMINLYLHNPEKILNQCLKFCMLSILKLSYFLREILVDCGNYEEEEFLAYTYDFDLASSYTSQDLLAELKTLIQTIGNDENQSEYNLAIKNRLELTFSLLMIVGLYFDVLQNSKVQSQVDSFAHMHICENGYLKSDQLDVQNPKFCEDFLNKIKSALQNVEKSYYEAELCTENNVDDEGTQFKQLLAHGFEPLVNMKLLPSTFPREVKFLKPSTAYSYIYYRLCEYIKLSLTLLEKPQTHSKNYNLYPNFLKFLKIFDGYLNNKDDITNDVPSSPCLLARCLFQITYFQCLMKVPPCSTLSLPNLTRMLPQNGHIPNTSPIITFSHFTEQIKFSIACFSNNKLYLAYEKDASIENNIDTSALSMFLIDASTVSLSLVNVQMLHPTKRRDKLPLILRDLAYIQEEAERLDEYYAAFKNHQSLTFDQSCPKYNPYFSWVLYTTMLSYLLYGFDLQLYSQYELPYIYWYLSKIYAYLDAMFMILNYKPSPPELISENGYKLDHGNSHEDRVLDYSIFSILCQTYYKCTLAMSVDGQIDKPEYEFTTQKVRFEHRTSPLTPPGASRWSYEAYRREEQQSRDSSCHSPGVTALYREAELGFRKAADLLSSTRNFTKSVRCPEPFPLDDEHQATGDHMRRLCKGNAIACAAILSRRIDIDERGGNANQSPKMALLSFNSDPRFTKLEHSKVHTYFPLIKILPRTSS